MTTEFKAQARLADHHQGAAGARVGGDHQAGVHLPLLLWQYA